MNLEIACFLCNLTAIYNLIDDDDDDDDYSYCAKINITSLNVIFFLERQR